MITKIWLSSLWTIRIIFFLHQTKVSCILETSCHVTIITSIGCPIWIWTINKLLLGKFYFCASFFSYLVLYCGCDWETITWSTHRLISSWAKKLSLILIQKYVKFTAAVKLSIVSYLFSSIYSYWLLSSYCLSVGYSYLLASSMALTTLKSP